MTTTQPAPAPPRKKRRGFEGTGDMVRSLGLVLLIVVPIWFLAQPTPEDQKELRVVDQTADLQAWTSTTPGAPVPQQLPGWRPTVSRYDGADGALRLGWNTAAGDYAEFAASTTGTAGFVEELTGTRQQDGTEDVDGVAWRRYVDDDGSLSLVREVGGATVVVGTTRASASREEVRALAGSVSG